MIVLRSELLIKLSLESLDLTQIDILHANIWALFVQVNSLPVILTPQLALYCLPMIENPLGIRIKLQHSSQLTFNWPHSISDASQIVIASYLGPGQMFLKI